MSTGTRVDERIASLERRIEALQQIALQSQARNAIADGITSHRIAEVATSSPQQGDNTFMIKFLDGEYTRSEGNQSPLWLPRQNLAQEFCYNLAGTVPPLGTKLLVHFWSGRWWTRWEEGGEAPQTTDFGASNIFYTPHWHQLGGLNPGQLDGTSTTRRFASTLGDHVAFYIYFQDRIGPDIGCTVGSAYNTAIQLNEPGVYMFDFRVTALPGIHRDSPGTLAPDPPIPFGLRCELDLGSSNDRLPIWPTSIQQSASATWRSEWFADPLVDPGFPLYQEHAVYSVSAKVADEWKTFTPPAVRTVNIQVYRMNLTVIQPALTDDLNYGFTLQHPSLVVTRIG